MKYFILIVLVSLVAFSGQSEVVCQASSSDVVMSSLPDGASVGRGLTLRYSPLSEASVTICASGQNLRMSGVAGSYVWRARALGQTVLTHMVGETVWEQRVTANLLDDSLSIGEAVGAPELNWSTSGDAPWEGHQTSERSCDGESAACSGLLTHGQKSELSVSVEGAGSLSFDWRTSCQPRYDAVWLLVDGETVRQLTGETTWTNVTVSVGNGMHIISWTYQKNRSVSEGEDAVWIDNVVWKPAENPTLAEALGDTLGWTTDGDAEWEAVRTDAAFEGGICAISGLIGNNGCSYLETHVSGAGRLDFVWAVSCEEYYDHFTFYVDGELAGALTGEQEWMAKKVTVGEGEHTFRWEYWKDEYDEPGMTGSDCGFLDYVRWTPAGGVTDPDIGTERLAEFSRWLKEHRQLAINADIREAQSLKTVCASGKTLTLLDEFVAGTDPEIASDTFTANVEIVDGVPVITWSPALNGEGVKDGIRHYTVFGSKTLVGPWETVTDGQESSYRFFKVTVDLNR